MILPWAVRSPRIRPIISIPVTELARRDRRKSQTEAHFCRGMVAARETLAVALTHRPYPKDRSRALCKGNSRSEIRTVGTRANRRSFRHNTFMEEWFNCRRPLADFYGAEFPCPRGHANVTGNAAPAGV
jgi:hypothetical protein